MLPAESRLGTRPPKQIRTELTAYIKTTTSRLKALEACVLANHPYDSPEFVVLPITTGNKRYLDWISASVKEA